MRTNILLQLFQPYLTPIEAEEIRTEIAAFNPRVHLVMADWPWIEVRGVTAKRAAELLENLRAKGVKFRVMVETKNRRGREVPTI